MGHDLWRIEPAGFSAAGAGQFRPVVERTGGRVCRGVPEATGTARVPPASGAEGDVRTAVAAAGRRAVWLADAAGREPRPQFHAPRGVWGQAAMHVLLVEDDDLVRECLSLALGEAGLSVTEAAGAGQALGSVDGGEMPAVLVTDLELGPGMDGVALIEAARRRWPCVRTVLISGADVTESRLAPGDKFLRKPFRIDALLEAIEEMRRDRP